MDWEKQFDKFWDKETIGNAMVPRKDLVKDFTRKQIKSAEAKGYERGQMEGIKFGVESTLQALQQHMPDDKRIAAIVKAGKTAIPAMMSRLKARK